MDLHIAFALEKKDFEYSITFVLNTDRDRNSEMHFKPALCPGEPRKLTMEHVEVGSTDAKWHHVFRMDQSKFWFNHTRHMIRHDSHHREV